MAKKEITAAEAVQSTEESAVPAETAKTKAVDPYKDTIKIRLPLTRTEKDDVLVGVNGRTWLIQRGVDVEVPKCVAEVLRHRERMLMQSMDYEAKAADKA